MPKPLAEVEESDIDPKTTETIKEVAYQGAPPVTGSVVGILTGLGISRGIDKLAEAQPENQRVKTKIGLKIVSTAGGLTAIAASTGMDEGPGRTATLVGGAAHTATTLIEMVSDLFNPVREAIFPKDVKGSPKKWRPQKKKVAKEPEAAHEPPAEFELRGR